MPAKKQTTSDANGNYSFSGLAAGTYYVTRVFPSGYRISNGTNGHVTVNLAAGQTASGVNIGTTSLAVSSTPKGPSAPVPPTPPAPTPAGGTAAITGKLFAQISRWNSEVNAIRWNFFLDANGDGVRGPGEAFVPTASDGTYSLRGLAAGTYTLALEPVGGWKIITPKTTTMTLTLKSGQTRTGAELRRGQGVTPRFNAAIAPTLSVTHRPITESAVWFPPAVTSCCRV